MTPLERERMMRLEARAIAAESRKPDAYLSRRAEIERAVRALGYEPGKLQWKWRHLDALPAAFDSQEVNAALLDALVVVGGITAWSGDGTGCATQIVEAVWKLAAQLQRERDEALVEAARLLSVLRHVWGCPTEPFACTDPLHAEATAIVAGLGVT